MAPPMANLDARLLRFRNDPGSEPPVGLAAALLDEGRDREAAEVSEAGLRRQPTDAELGLLLGRSLIGIGEMLLAQKAFLQSARSAPKDPRPLRWLGEVLLRRGDPGRAKKVLAKARALGGGDDDAIRKLLERATRFERIADEADTGEVEAAPSPPATPPAAPPRSAPAPMAPPKPAAAPPRSAPAPMAPPKPAAAPPRSAPAPKPAAAPPRSAPAPMAPPKPAAAPPRSAPAPMAPPVAAPPSKPAPAAPRPSAQSRPTPVAPPSSMPPAARPTFADDEDEATVVASDLSAQLAAAQRLDAGPASAPVVDEDQPTTMMDRASLDLPDDRPAAPDPFADDVPTKLAPAAVPPGPLGGPPSPLAPSPLAPSSLAPSSLAPSPAAADSDDVPLPWDQGELEAQEPVADLSAGERAGQPEDVDAVLGMLRERNLFEEAEGPPQAWASAKEARAPKTRTLGFHIATWVIGLAVIAGAWFGYQYWIGAQEKEAATLAERAIADARRGDHENLVDAERNLRRARELHPLAPSGPDTLLFVHGQRALEDGSFQAGYLRPSLDLARRVELESPRITATEAVLAYAEGDAEEGAEALEAAREAAGDDAESLYLIGRLEQRLGDERAAEHLAAAIEQAPDLAAAHLALAEDAFENGRSEEAAEHLGAVLERYEDHLRALLWTQYLAADDEEPDAVLARVNDLEARLEKGAPTDVVLYHLTRARLLRRKGELEPAEAAVEEAARAGATEPRLQALVASAAFALGELPRAQQAATAAVSAAPAIPEYRKLLAEIMVARRDGVGALRVLAPLSSEDPDVLRASARAALLVGSEESLAATTEALNAHLEGQEEPSVEMQALLLRARAKTGSSRGMLREAQRLVREAPGDPDAGLALAEVALAEGAVREALEALEAVTAAAPRDPDGHYLLGRARRMANQADEAEDAFRKALELQPGFADARIDLGYLLLDRGDHAEAEELYAELGRTSGARGTAVVARLGRAEALIGLGRLDDAKVQLEGLPDEAAALPSAQIVRGRLALAENEPGEAAQILRPLAEAEGATTDSRALYADALRMAGQGQAAAELYEGVLAADEGHPEALLGYAEVLLRGDKAREAERIVARAESALEERIRPPAARARMLTLRGRVALEQRDERAATTALRAATEMPSAPAEAHFYLGEALAGRDSPAAREAYQKYLELAPEGPLAGRARRATR